MKLWLFIALGGALGAMSRYGGSLLIHGWLGRGFPYGTLTVNVLGSFIIGLVSVLFMTRFPVSVEMRSLVMVGFLGALTTFSSFSLETLMLLQKGNVLAAGANILLNVSLCLLVVWLGVVIGRLWV